jgi:hypothetical protein
VKKQRYVPALANVATPARERPRSAREAVMVAEWLVSLLPNAVTPSASYTALLADIAGAGSQCRYRRFLDSRAE